MTDHAALIVRYYDACSAGDLDALLGTLHPEMVHYFLAPNPGSRPVAGAEHLARYWRKVAPAIQARWVVDHLVADGDRAVIEWTMFWVPRDSAGGERIATRGSEWFEVRDGLIAEIRSYYQQRDTTTELDGFPYSERGYSDLGAEHSVIHGALAPVDDSRQLTVSLVINAPIERVFAMLADPDCHPELDGSGMLRRSRTHEVLTGVGETFTMDMHHELLGDYQTDNVVTVYERDRAIGWAPAAAGQEPFGHTFTYLLEPDGDDRTLVAHTYNWSQVTADRVLKLCPVVSAEQMTATLERLDAALA
jgi:ketosteroid isomerase-like protein/uncharacterized protein YndB with AHSA1/START domain